MKARLWGGAYSVGMAVGEWSGTTTKLFPPLAPCSRTRRAAASGRGWSKLGALKGHEAHRRKRECVENGDLAHEDAERVVLVVAIEMPILEPVRRVFVVVALEAPKFVENERFERPAGEAELRRPRPIAGHLVDRNGVAAEEHAELEESRVEVERRLLIGRDRGDEVGKGVAGEREAEHDAVEEDKVRGEEAAAHVDHGIGDDAVGEDERELDDGVERASGGEIRKDLVEAGGDFPIEKGALGEEGWNGL
mmetsp:Transcript_9113/g.28924  ORF Transcript_9113/g.28924 Transcript_9113/m.28924 type:complete len:250 (-) Transcript_9113:3019-3768(-)